MPKHSPINSLDQIQATKSVLIFSSKSCGPCRQYERELQNFSSEDVHIYPADAHTAKELVSMFNVECVPYSVFLKDKKEVFTRTGGMQLKEFEECVEKAFQ